MEIEYKAEYKSDADRVTEILRSEGYQVERGIVGLNISNGKHTIGAVLEPDPDLDDGTQFFVGSNDDNTDGYLVLFQEGCPEDERYEICRSVKMAFEDEEEYASRR